MDHVPHMSFCSTPDCRSAGAEAGRPDPAETEPRRGGHLHPGGGQTERRQVHDQVGRDPPWNACARLLRRGARLRYEPPE